MNTITVSACDIQVGDILHGLEVSHIRPHGQGMEVWVQGPNVNNALGPRKYGIWYGQQIEVCRKR